MIFLFRLLECGQHKCEQMCHPGACDKCSLLPSEVTHCHCGQTALEDIKDSQPRTSCTDPIPVCGKICNKELTCGPPGKSTSFNIEVYSSGLAF